MKNLKSLVLLFSLSMFLVTSIQAQNWWKNGIKGEGPVVTRTLNVNNFNGVSLGFSGNVYIKQGSSHSVKVEGQENIINNIKTDVSNGIWKINFDKNVKDHKKLTVYITMPTLTKASVSGSGNIVGQSKFTGLKDFTTSVSGSGNVSLDVASSSVTSKISGSGNIELKGSTGDFEIHISGSGNIRAYQLSSSNCEVHISGSGDCEVDVSNTLNVQVSGSGDVRYSGSPNVRSKVSGSGDVTSRS